MDNNENFDFSENSSVNELEFNTNDSTKTKKKKSKVLSNIIRVASSNILTIIAGVLSGFLVPKMMEVSDYGLFKTFSLYIGYVGIFHFGFLDGIYLKFGGIEYNDLNKEKMRTYTKFFLIFQIIMSVIVSIIALCFKNTSYGIIFLFVSVGLFLTNTNYFYQYIAQITGKFKILSARNAINAALTAISVLGFYVLVLTDTINTLPYWMYLICVNLVLLILVIWYLFTFSDITFGKSAKFKDEKDTIFSFFKMGIPLLIANLTSSLILTIDKQFVSIGFDEETYGTYAFAYTMVTLITTAISAISTVLYPYLKRSNEEDLKKNYNYLNSLIIIFVGLCLASYYPLKWFIEIFLEKYTNSIPVFRIILPGLILSSVVNMIMYNYYKSLNKSFTFFVKSLIILLLSTGLNFLAYFLWHSEVMISIMSIISLFVWYIITDWMFVKRWKMHTHYNLLYIILLAIVFYCLTEFINNPFLGLLLYLVLFSIITLVFNKKLIKNKFKNI